MKIRIILVNIVVFLAFYFNVNSSWAQEVNGSVYSGTVKSSKSGKTWPATLKIIEYNPTTGSVEGELHWPNLGSIHKIVGQLTNSRFTFKEIEYIKKGSAFLNCEYSATFKNDALSGSWTDRDADNGTFLFSKQTDQTNVVVLTNNISNSVYTGVVKSSKSGKTWPATLKIIEHNSNTGRIVGELHWSNLGSIHKVVGQLSDNRLTFKETEYIKKGSAFLNCEYNASLKNELLTGNWSDPNGDNGSFQLSKQSGGLSNVNGITNNIAQTAYTGVVSSKSGKTWPATLKIVEHNLNTGRIIGELHWPNLGAIHKIIGQLSDSRLTFKETDYIKKGNANLNCEYDASLKNGLVSGNWSDPSGDNGTFKLNKD